MPRIYNALPSYIVLTTPIDVFVVDVTCVVGVVANIPQSTAVGSIGHPWLPERGVTCGSWLVRPMRLHYTRRDRLLVVIRMILEASALAYWNLIPTFRVFSFSSLPVVFGYTVG